MIRHTVSFRLRHPASSPAEAAFLADALVLADIPGVQRFERMRQTSPQSEHRFGFAMEFADAAAYAAYNEHPLHQAFVAERWVPEIESFQELDFERY